MPRSPPWNHGSGCNNSSNALRPEGGLMELRNEGQCLALYKRTCPFIGMFDEARNVCCLDLDMIRNVVRAPVRQAASRHDGEPCCVFELDNEK